eukprot:6210925-Pleurochrysis_carterae.AAC.3
MDHDGDARAGAAVEEGVDARGQGEVEQQPLRRSRRRQVLHDGAQRSGGRSGSPGAGPAAGSGRSRACARSRALVASRGLRHQCRHPAQKRQTQPYTVPEKKVIVVSADEMRYRAGDENQILEALGKK